MEIILYAALGVAIGVIVGFAIAKTLEKNNASKLIKNAKKSAAAILRENV